MLWKSRKLVPLAQSSEAMEAQASSFLETNGFPNTAEYRKLFGAFVQHLPEHQDSFDPRALASMIRKARANEAAFYMMYPERKPKAEGDGPKETASEVVPETQS